MSIMATILNSFKEASQVLKERGLKIVVKKMQEIAKRYAQRNKIVKQPQDIEILARQSRNQIFVGEHELFCPC